jgi:hypothetical protein
MLGSHNDGGARCPRHYSEPFLVRCPACESIAVEFRQLGIEVDPDASTQ